MVSLRGQLRLAGLAVLLLCVSAQHAGGYRQPIQRATEYLKKNAGRITGDTLLTLEILNRNYNTNFDVSAAREKFLRKPPPAYRIWLRNIDRKQVLTELEVRAQKLWPGLMAAALYCDIYALPWDFVERVHKVSAGGGYGVTRSLFAISIAEWQGCAHDATVFSAEKEKLVVEIPGIIQRSGIGSDLWLECILSLFFVGKGDWVTHDLMTMVAGSQRENGSWDDSVKTTAKALWVFLEAERYQESRQKRQLRLLP